MIVSYLKCQQPFIEHKRCGSRVGFLQGNVRWPFLTCPKFTLWNSKSKLTHLRTQPMVFPKHMQPGPHTASWKNIHIWWFCLVFCYFWLLGSLCFSGFCNIFQCILCISSEWKTMKLTEDYQGKLGELKWLTIKVSFFNIAIRGRKAPKKIGSNIEKSNKMWSGQQPKFLFKIFSTQLRSGWIMSLEESWHTSVCAFVDTLYLTFAIGCLHFL